MITINLKLCGPIIIQVGFSAYLLQGHNLASPSPSRATLTLASVYSKCDYRHKYIKPPFHCCKKVSML